MSDRARNIYDMFVSTLAFDAANSADYATLTAAAAQFAIVQTAVDAMAVFFATQTSGERAAAVEQKSVLRPAIRRKMTAYSKTARALNLDTPGFDKLFSVPDDDNDGLLLATGREFVTQATTHHAAFATLGIPAGNAADLTADLDAFEAAQDAKVTAQATTVGATAGIDDQIDAAMKAEKMLDAIMHNVYGNNPVKLAAWKTSRHVKRAPKHAPVTPPTP